MYSTVHNGMWAKCPAMCTVQRVGKVVYTGPGTDYNIHQVGYGVIHIPMVVYNSVAISDVIVFPDVLSAQNRISHKRDRPIVAKFVRASSNAIFPFQ